MVQRTCEINLVNLIKLGLKTVLYLMLLRINQQDYNVMIDGKNVFDRRIENDINTYENIPKFTTGQRDNTQLVVC